MIKDQVTICDRCEDALADEQCEICGDDICERTQWYLFWYKEYAVISFMLERNLRDVIHKIGFDFSRNDVDNEKEFKEKQAKIAKDRSIILCGDCKSDLDLRDLDDSVIDNFLDNIIPNITVSEL